MPDIGPLVDGASSAGAIELARLVVKDGWGVSDVVPPEVAPTLVDPFVRRRGRTEDHTGGRADGPGSAGRGLGLAIVDPIATAHRARLDVVPRDGGGLRVSALLPR